MSCRDEFYIFKPEYDLLKNLAEVIGQEEIQNQILISYIDTHNLDPNSYVCPNYNPEKREQNVWMTLLFYSSKFLFRKNIVIYLLGRGADPRKMTDSESPMNICFYCNEYYLKRFAAAAPPAGDITRQIEDKLVTGSYHRLMILERYKCIDSHHYRSVIKCPDLLLKIINAMINRIVISINMEGVDKTSIVNQVVSKYLPVICVLWTHGLQLDKVSLDRCIDNYLYEIIASYPFGSTGQVQYHADMDERRVAILRPLLNDYRYVQTCRVLYQEPDPRAF